MIQRLRNRSRIPLVALSLLAAVPLAWAHYEYLVDYEFPWPYSGSMPAFQHADQGLLENDDALPEFAFLADGTVHVMDAPGQQLYFDTLDGVTATAFAVEHRSSAADRLIVSDSSGLRAYAWSSTSNGYALDATLSTAAAYQSLSGLQLATHPSSGTVHLTALQSDGTTLRSATLSGNTLSAVASFQFPIAVQAWRALDWDGVEGQEIAVKSAAGVTVHEPDSTLLLGPVSLASGYPCLWSFTDAGLGSDRLVVPVTSGGQHYVYLVDQRYPDLEPALQVESSPDGFQLVDEFEGSEPDLVVSFLDGETMVFSGNTAPQFPTQSTFDDSPSEPLGISNGQDGTARHLAVADFDLDGDDDVMAIEPDQGVWLHRNWKQSAIAGMLGGPTALEGEGVELTTDLVQQTMSFPITQPSAGNVDGFRVEIFLARYNAHTQQVETFDPQPLWDEVGEFGVTQTDPYSATWAEFEHHAAELFVTRLTPLDANGEQDGPAMTFYYYTAGGGSGGGTPGYPPKPGPGPCTGC